MKKLKKILICILIISSLCNIYAKSSKKAKSETEKEDKAAKTTAQWYIYEKNNKNVYNGPFETVEDAIIAWRADPNIEQKGKYYIGKDTKLITNNPLVYYKSKIAEMDAAKSLPASVPEEEISETEASTCLIADEKEDTAELDEAENEYEFDEFETEEHEFESTEIAQEDSDSTEIFKVDIVDEPVNPVNTEIEKNEKIDRYKKTYLSDFIDVPEYPLPEEEKTPEVNEELLADMNRVDSFGRTSLMNAIKSGNDWQIRSLLNAGADVNAKDNEGWTPLMYAVRYQSNLQIVEFILNSEPDIKALNKYGHSALIIASCYNNNPDIIKKMLTYYNPSEKEVQKAFILLLSSQSISEYILTEKMKVFLDLGLPINSYYNGKTPLMYACKYSSSTKAIKLLLDNNATVTVRSSEGKTAFQYAAENKKLAHDDIYWSLNIR